MTVGSFVWRELVHPDLDAAKAFYTAVLGWRWTASSGPMDYHEAHVGDVAVAGAMAQAQTQGAPAGWTSYVHVDDLDACCERVRAAGGTVAFGPITLPGVGSFASVVDPHGASSMAFAPQGESRPAPEAAGTFCWESVQHPDPDAAAAFYGAVYGWTASDTPAGRMFASSGTPVAHVGPIEPEVRAHWIPYVVVEDLPAALARAEAAGGAVLLPPLPVPGMGRFGVIADPGKVPLALYQAATPG